MKQRFMKKIDKVDIVAFGISLIACLITLYPMWYTLACSFSDIKAVNAGKVTLWPVGFSVKAYRMVLEQKEFYMAAANSVINCTLVCILQLATTVMMAFPLTRPNLKYRKFVVWFILIPMYFGGGMIPSFLLINKLGLYNTRLALILPSAVGLWNIVLCRTYMASLPGDLFDAALVDGAGQIKTLIKIVIPLSKPVLAVIAMYIIVGEWNSWFGASIYTTKTSLKPLQLYLKNFLTQLEGASVSSELLMKLPKEQQIHYQEMAAAGKQLKYAMIILTTAPIIAIYPMFQKYFTKGIMLGSLKG